MCNFLLVLEILISRRPKLLASSLPLLELSISLCQSMKTSRSASMVVRTLTWHRPLYSITLICNNLPSLPVWNAIRHICSMVLVPSDLPLSNSTIQHHSSCYVRLIAQWPPCMDSTAAGVDKMLPVGFVCCREPSWQQTWVLQASSLISSANWALNVGMPMSFCSYYLLHS